MTLPNPENMLSILQTHETATQRKGYLRFICRNHHKLQSLLTAYQHGDIPHGTFVKRFNKTAKASLVCLHTLLAQNFSDDEVLFRIFPRVDIPYVRILSLFSEWEWKRMMWEIRYAKNECILRIAGKLEELEREEETWDVGKEGERW
ncbi:hypothetical protein E6O75_ATG07676 [Venturia nashicola]|uniref:Uncharacterized protein n=1 Tax=Venturia nashicola TaxID=86259 RepID=A0A4Z1PEC0_9PEZI|nr:hypothetical protein E6O75_ATG07676 [Venturia nashicola]